MENPKNGGSSWHPLSPNMLALYICVAFAMALAPVLTYVVNLGDFALTIWKGSQFLTGLSAIMLALFGWRRTRKQKGKAGTFIMGYSMIIACIMLGPLVFSPIIEWPFKTLRLVDALLVGSLFLTIWLNWFSIPNKQQMLWLAGFFALGGILFCGWFFGGIIESHKLGREVNDFPVMVSTLGVTANYALIYMHSFLVKRTA